MQTSMGQSLENLPDDLIVEILLMLPARSLVQLKSVCRSWRDLISSPQFARIHSQRSIAHSSLTHLRLAFIYFSNRVFKFGICSVQSLLDNPSKPTTSTCSTVSFNNKIVGHCNGFLCWYDTRHKLVRLCNPFTKLASPWMEIGPIPSSHGIGSYGLGYDHVHDKYKLALIYHEYGGTETVTKLCSFGANPTWKTIQKPPVHNIDNYGEFVSGSGTLNWIACEPFAILFLDLGTETYGQMSLPHVERDDKIVPTIQALRNCLCACIGHGKTRWSVWLMKVYGDEQSWTKLAMIITPTVPNYYRMRPLCVSEDGVVLAWAFHHGLVMCNSNEDPAHQIECFIDGPLQYPSAHTTFRTYHESLVSPSHLGLPCFSLS